MSSLSSIPAALLLQLRISDVCGAQISEEIVLDQNTTIPGYAVARPMASCLEAGRSFRSYDLLPFVAEVSAGLVMHPRVDCTFTTLEAALVEQIHDSSLFAQFCLERRGPSMQHCLKHFAISSIGSSTLRGQTCSGSLMEASEIDFVKEIVTGATVMTDQTASYSHAGRGRARACSMYGSFLVSEP